jgi:hypothetical protein
MKYSNDPSIAYCSIECPEELYSHDIPEYKYGYRLIGKQLVPIRFLSRLEDHLGCTTFDACCVISPRAMVGESFWEELDAEEQEVLPACLFLLIDEGRITFTVPA